MVCAAEKLPAYRAFSDGSRQGGTCGIGRLPTTGAGCFWGG